MKDTFLIQTTSNILKLDTLDRTRITGTVLGVRSSLLPGCRFTVVSRRAVDSEGGDNAGDK